MILGINSSRLVPIVVIILCLLKNIKGNFINNTNNIVSETCNLYRLLFVRVHTVRMNVVKSNNMFQFALYVKCKSLFKMYLCLWHSFPPLL